MTPPEGTDTRPRPNAPYCVVRLTTSAVEDLGRLFKADPQIVRWALKKMIHLEQNPRAGEPLLSGLVGYRKIVVGDRDWRVVWRVREDELGASVVEVAEIWAVGYRKESEVYSEVSTRVRQAGDQPATRALTEVLAMFAKQSRGLSATPEPVDADPVPKWLRDALVHVVRLPKDEVDHLTLEQAEAAWERYTTGPGSRR